MTSISEKMDCAVEIPAWGIPLTITKLVCGMDDKAWIAELSLQRTFQKLIILKSKDKLNKTDLNNFCLKLVLYDLNLWVMDPASMKNNSSKVFHLLH